MVSYTGWGLRASAELHQATFAVHRYSLCPPAASTIRHCIDDEKKEFGDGNNDNGNDEK